MAKAKNAFIGGLTRKLIESGVYDQESNTLFTTNPAISYDVLKGLAKRHGFAIGQTKNAEYVSIPLADKYKNLENEYVGMYDAFMETYTFYNKNWATLLSAYKTFDLMDENLAEVGLILDTYVSEVLAQGFVENPLKIKISDPKAQKIVEHILYKNKIYQRLPNIVRSIAKYGNYGMLLSYPYLETWLAANKDNPDFNQIDVIEDLHIKFVNPKHFKVNVDEYDNVINYETLEDNTYTTRNTNNSPINNKVWQPWQFVHFLIPDELTEPYGKSMLWAMRSAFDQLTTLEALLGISRASKIQRLVFYVPIPNSSAITDAYGYMNEFRTLYLNSMFADAPGAKAGRKIPGATSILTLPVAADGKKVEVDHIEANIDLSSTEDVDYFRDKVLTNSKLPKGYLIGEDVITTAQTLEAQDLKLKRALIPLKKAFIDGMMWLVENILTHAGYDVSKLDVSVSINEPIQVAADTIQKYNDIFELLKGLSDINPQMPNVNKFQFLVKLGIPVDLAQLVCSNSSVNLLSTPDDLGKFLAGQITKLTRDVNSAPIEDDDLEETVGMTISSKQFLKEYTYLANKYEYFYSTKRSAGKRDLKEALYNYQIKPITEDSKDGAK